MIDREKAIQADGSGSNSRRKSSLGPTARNSTVDMGDLVGSALGNMGLDYNTINHEGKFKQRKKSKDYGVGTP